MIAAMRLGCPERQSRNWTANVIVMHFAPLQTDSEVSPRLMLDDWLVRPVNDSPVHSPRRLIGSVDASVLL
jgi:hypothetical protein